MIDFLARLFESVYYFIFDTQGYGEALCDVVYSNNDYLWLGGLIILIPLVILAVFYVQTKLPLKFQKLQWLVVILVVLLISFFASRELLYGNSGLRAAIQQYDTEINLIDPFDFIRNLAFVSTGYALVTSLIFSFFLRFISPGNRNNPF